MQIGHDDESIVNAGDMIFGFSGFNHRGITEAVRHQIVQR
jgi:hypothetical protein